MLVEHRFSNDISSLSEHTQKILNAENNAAGHTHTHTFLASSLSTLALYGFAQLFSRRIRYLCIFHISLFYSERAAATLETFHPRFLKYVS